MANQLQLAGAAPQKPTRFAPIYTGRFFSGIWTNRSPLRDAATTRYVERYVGPNGDAIIAGSNVEITNRLTLARRPGNSIYDSNSWNAVTSLTNFNLFGINTEQIKVMIDQANAYYSLYNGTKSLVWTKSSGAGNTYSQAVGNSLYFGNGVDNKKWLQSLITWSSGAQWNTATTPFLNTFLIDGNGNIQQLTSTVIPISTIQITSNVLTVTSSQTLTNVLTTGLSVTFPAGMTASFLNNQTVVITSVSGNTFTAAFAHANYGPTVEINKIATVVAGGTPISGSVLPAWSTTVPSSLNNFQGGTTVDGTVLWTNRGIPTENWGIVAPNKTLSPTIGTSRIGWAANTFYSPVSVIIDSNGNLQKVTTAGTSGSTAPVWNNVLSGTTSDGSVTWTMIQTAASLNWAAHHTYNPGDFIVANNCLFQLDAFSGPTIVGNVDAYNYNHSHTVGVGGFTLTFPTTLGSALSHVTGNSLSWDSGSNVSVNPMKWDTLNGAGEVTATTTPFPGTPTDFQMIALATINIPVAGQYTVKVTHHDGMFFGFGGSASVVSSQLVSVTQTQTAAQGYTVMAGQNLAAPAGGALTTTATINFPTAGNYPLEINYAFWYHSGQTLVFQINGNNPVPGTPESGTTAPNWPGWTDTYAPAYPNVSEASGQLTWNNLGPITDFAWKASTGFTLPNTSIIDLNGNNQAPYRSGVSGSTAPTFSSGINQLTADAPNLEWICTGPASAPPFGTLSVFNGGWQYGIALVNSLDDTVSNCGPLSTATGNFVGVNSVNFAPGAGLPPVAQIDPQSDYVAIFRTTDGQTTPFLIPGTGNAVYTVPLSTYLTSGYQDTTPDTSLNNQLSGPISQENTPPLAGAINLVYHLNRIFFSVGNVIYWTSGPSDPIGNGLNGVAPLNFDVCPSLVVRMVPTSIGLLVFTVSDVYLIQGQGTTSNPIQTAQPYLQRVGLNNYWALAVNGSIIGLFTTDHQFIILDPSSGVSYCGFPIGDQFRQNNNTAGTAWGTNVYVTWHVDGEDQAWYVGDSQFGWYRLMATPAPETGYTWSPFASIVGGCKAINSVEVSPGVHKLLVGPSGTGPILKRDLTVFTDNNTAYSANAVIGSIVLSEPGQVAELSFITTDSVRTGTPLSLGILFDEALPYYTGPFSPLTVWVTDPPSLPESSSLLGQRFYFSESEATAVCRHLQLKVDFGIQSVQNELLTLTIYGSFMVEN